MTAARYPDDALCAQNGVTIPLDWPAELLSANDRYHHMKVAKIVKAWRTHAYTKAVQLELEMTYMRARIVVHYRFPTNHRREVSNLQPTSKAIVDGLVDAGLIPDDDDKHVIGPDNRREYPNGTPRVTVTITGVKP